MLPRVWSRLHAIPTAAQCVTVTSWFFDRDLEMTEFEPLARASALLLSGGGAQLLAAAHVTHPHRRAWLYPGAPAFLSSIEAQRKAYQPENERAPHELLATLTAAHFFAPLVTKGLRVFRPQVLTLLALLVQNYKY